MQIRCKNCNRLLYVQNGEIKQIRTADFTEEVNGKPKHTLNSLMSTIEKGIVLAGKIADAERLIRKDIEEEVAARGNAKRKILDDELL